MTSRSLAFHPALARSTLLLLAQYQGDRDNAFRWLEKAYQERDWCILYLKADPVWEPIRSDPRFANLLRRVGLAQ